MRPSTAIALLLTGLTLLAHAQESKQEPKSSAPPVVVPEPPPMPPEEPATAPETGLEPQVTIVPRGTEIHEEYRINGQLYMIKVIPAKGKPYYLIDYEGNGRFRRSDIEPILAIPTWVLKRF